MHLLGGCLETQDDVPDTRVCTRDKSHQSEDNQQNVLDYNVAEGTVIRPLDAEFHDRRESDAQRREAQRPE